MKSGLFNLADPTNSEDFTKIPDDAYTVIIETNLETGEKRLVKYYLTKPLSAPDLDS